MFYCFSMHVDEFTGRRTVLVKTFVYIVKFVNIMYIFFLLKYIVKLCFIVFSIHAVFRRVVNDGIL